MTLCIDEELNFSLCDASVFSSLAGGSYDAGKYGTAKKLATQKILSFLNRNLFYSENQKETVAGSGGHVVFLSRYPLREIKTVRIDGDDLGGNFRWFNDGVNGGLQRDNAYPITYSATRIEYQIVYRAGDAIKKIEIVYSGGYVAPEQVDQACPAAENHAGVASGMPALLPRREMPVDIVYAACLEALKIYQQIDTGAGDFVNKQSIQSFSLGDYSETRKSEATKHGLMQ